MSIRDSFEKLRKTILNTDTAEIDKTLDQAIKDISSFRQQSTSKSYINLVKNLISKQFGSSLSFKSEPGLFSQGVASPVSFGQSNKLNRYKTYQSIITNINYCYRALSVLVDNILAPDDITKISLDIKPKQLIQDKNRTDSNVSSVKETITKLKLEKNLHIIVKNTLLYGDFFCEISNAKKALLSKSLILEGANNLNKEEVIIEDLKTINGNDIRLKIRIDYSLYQNEEYLGEIENVGFLREDGSFAGGAINPDSEDEPKNSDAKKKAKEDKAVEDLMLVFHEPDRVVKLQSSLFPICFGYLVFPKYNISQAASLEDQAINNICSNILKNLQNKIPQTNEISDIEDLKDVIRKMSQTTSLGTLMEIRYVPPERMQHFLIPSTKYFPYGESIFDSTIFLSKVLVAMETALAIQRLNRSTEKRKIEVEIGLPRDARQVIEE